MKNDIYDNEQIIRNFKGAKDGVLVNIRMLTEGVDIPDVKTALLTRQTTSSILMTQMVGRAMRGEKAGGGPGKDTANIVLFIDNWKGLIDVWAHPGSGIGEDYVVRGHRPYEIVSIHLVELLSRRIESGKVPDMPYSCYIPIGWYRTDITVSVESDPSSPKEEMQNFIEYVTVYEHTRDKFEKFIKEKFEEIPESWSDEKLDEKSIEPKVTDWMGTYFDITQDHVTGDLLRDLIKVSRHIAKNGTAPEFHPFTERDCYDLDNLVMELAAKRDDERYRELMMIFDEAVGKVFNYYKFYLMFAKIGFALEIYVMQRSIYIL